MTEPNPDQPQQSEQPPRPARRPKVGDVVAFTRTDPILRHEHRGIGVVSGSDANGVEVRPLESRTIRLALDEVTGADAADV